MGFSRVPQKITGKQLLTGAGNWTAPVSGNITVSLIASWSSTGGMAGFSRVLIYQTVAVTKGQVIAYSAGAAQPSTQNDSTFGALTTATGGMQSNVAGASNLMCPYGHPSSTDVAGAILVEW